ncbi:MAG: Apolipoprotein N-acyltransferase [Chlamydiae bacterium]|nr:Apolipoprotein N-acyltransferase [Chlamydiota bacterium]
MRAEIFLQGLISFLIVAFGMPSFAPILGPIAAALGYAIFWRAIRIYPFAKQRFWRACLWYGCISLIQLSWMTAIEYQGFYILFVWLSLSLWLGMQFGLLSVLIPYNRSLKLPRILAIAALWTLFEWSRYYFLCGYSWNLSGIAFCNTSAIQFAAIFGVLGLSFWVIFVNLIGLRSFLKKGIANYLIWLGLAFVPYLFGWGHIFYHEKHMTEDKQFSCLLVQTGLLPSEKTPIQGKIRAFISPYEQWRKILVHLKEHQDKSPDLIVLPEAAVPFSSETNAYEFKVVEQIFFEIFGEIPNRIFPEILSPYGDPSTFRVTNLFWAQSIANLYESEIVLGLDHAEEGGNSYNSAFHFIPFSTELTRYDKRVLMPLAEYLPFRWLMPLVKNYGISDFFTPGTNASLFYGKVPLSASICYEETFPDKVREGRLNGGKLFVNVTNDGWYSSSRLPSQHFEHAKFRAIENGIPLIRSCNTGVTAVVDSLGRCIDRIDQHDGKKKLQSGALFASVNLYEYSTPFLFWGNWGIVFLSGLFFGIFLCFKKQFHW